MQVKDILFANGSVGAYPTYQEDMIKPQQQDPLVDFQRYRRACHFSLAGSANS